MPVRGPVPDHSRGAEGGRGGWPLSVVQFGHHGGVRAGRAGGAHPGGNQGREWAVGDGRGVGKEGAPGMGSRDRGWVERPGWV